MEDNSKKKFSRKPMLTCEPENLRKLVAILGTNAAAGEALGLSATHVGKCLLMNEAKITYDLAAKALIMEMEREQVRPTFYLIEVPSAQREFLDTFLTNMKLSWNTV